MRNRILAVFAALYASGCASQLILQSRPQDAERVWQPAFAGAYFETRPSPVFTWLVGRAVRAGDPFFGEPLRTHPAARDAFLRAAGTGGVTRSLLNQLWRYTSADSIVIWQVWCDDGAGEDDAADFKRPRNGPEDEVEQGRTAEKYVISVAHADGTVDKYPVDAAKLTRCNLEHDRFTIHVSLYDRENQLPVARVVSQRVQGLNQALEIALAQAPNAFRVGSWSAWNWDALFAQPTSLP